jgi:hypothetical protein
LAKHRAGVRGRRAAWSVLDGPGMNTPRSQIRSHAHRRPAGNGGTAQRVGKKARGSVTALVTPATVDTSDVWWAVDAELLTALAGGAKSPEELGAMLGMSEHSVASLLSLLAQEGRVRIRLVEAVA